MDGDFPFTEDELAAELGLAFPDAEARRQAREAAASIQPGMDWALSETALVLLALASETGGAKVEALRREDQGARARIWSRDRPPGVSPEGHREQWERLVAAEDRAWAELCEHTRRSLPEPGWGAQS